jgi:hypothetical protein
VGIGDHDPTIARMAEVSWGRRRLVRVPFVISPGWWPSQSASASFAAERLCQPGLVAEERTEGATTALNLSWGLRAKGAAHDFHGAIRARSVDPFLRVAQITEDRCGRSRISCRQKMRSRLGWGRRVDPTSGAHGQSKARVF